jgi:UDP-N-acetylmuramoyl-L-alanyl-D-glutamate--2,6-diaminopimelate ligase
LNADDPACHDLKIARETELFWYSAQPDAKTPQRGTLVCAENIQSSFSGLKFDVVAGNERFGVVSSLVGHINVQNILLACTVGLTYGLSPEEIAAGIGRMSTVPGRFERVQEGQPFMVVVDYAHTDDALRNVIRVARGMNPKRIITVFGCGGDRDRSKRPLMGMAAAELSDYVVLTSDNPRSEDPLAIMADAMVGVSKFDTPHVAEPDRERAIRKAIELAEPGDVVILAGKGHETYQILKDGPIAFDDREVARRVLRSAGFKKS